jgi:hypothetical protein
MKWFSIEIEAMGDRQHAADQLDKWIEVLESLRGIYGPVASWGGLAGGPGARFSMEAPDVTAAVRRGVAAFTKGLAEFGYQAPIAHVDISTEDYLDLWLDQPAQQYVGLAEVARLLKVSKQRVFQLRARPDFPKPLVDLASGPVWTRDSLNHFLGTWQRRPGRPAKVERSPSIETAVAVDDGPARRRGAPAAAGGFRSGAKDISTEHDRYLAEDP